MCMYVQAGYWWGWTGATEKGIISEKQHVLGGGPRPFLCFHKHGLFCNNKNSKHFAYFFIQSHKCITMQFLLKICFMVGGRASLKKKYIGNNNNHLLTSQ